MPPKVANKGSSSRRTRNSRNSLNGTDRHGPGTSSSRTQQQRATNDEFTQEDFTVLKILLESRHARNMTCEDVLDSLEGAKGHTKEQWTSYLLRCIRSIEIAPPDEQDEDAHVEPPTVRRTRRQLHSSVRPPVSEPRRSTTSTTRRQPIVGSSSNRPKPTVRQPPASSESDMYTNPPSPQVTPNNVEIAGSDEDSKHEQDEAGNRDSPRLRSESPVPPTPGPPDARGYRRFTDEDVRYIVELGKKMFQQDPQTPKLAVAHMAGIKAPHHPTKSWASYLIKKPQLVHQMRRASVIVPYEVQEGSDDSADELPALSRGGQDGVEEDRATESEDIVLDSPAPDQPGDATEDERNLSGLGSKYSASDQRVLARYIATDPEWHSRSIMQNAKLFYEKYQKRSEGAWREYYNMHKEYIDSLASRMKLQKRGGDVKGKGRATGRSAGVSKRSEPGEDRSTSSTGLASTRTPRRRVQGQDERNIDTTSAESSRKRKGPDSGFDSDSRGRSRTPIEQGNDTVGFTRLT